MEEFNALKYTYPNLQILESLYDELLLLCKYMPYNERASLKSNMTKISQEDVRLRRALYGKLFEDISYLYHYLEADIVNSDYNPYWEIAYYFDLYINLPECRYNRFDEILNALLSTNDNVAF